MTTKKLEYSLNSEKYKLLKMTRNDKEVWWKSVPLHVGIGSTFHFVNNTCVDHFDTYENGEKIGKSSVKVDKCGKIAVGLYPTEFIKEPDSKIFICPDIWVTGNNPSPSIKLVENGSVLRIESDKPVILLWASTRGNLVKKI